MSNLSDFYSSGALSLNAPSWDLIFSAQDSSNITSNNPLYDLSLIGYFGDYFYYRDSSSTNYYTFFSWTDYFAGNKSSNLKVDLAAGIGAGYPTVFKSDTQIVFVHYSSGNWELRNSSDLTTVVASGTELELVGFNYNWGGLIDSKIYYSQGTTLGYYDLTNSSFNTIGTVTNISKGPHLIDGNYAYVQMNDGSATPYGIMKVNLSTLSVEWSANLDTTSGNYTRYMKLLSNGKLVAVNDYGTGGGALYLIDNSTGNVDATLTGNDMATAAGIPSSQFSQFGYNDLLLSPDGSTLMAKSLLKNSEDSSGGFKQTYGSFHLIDTSNFSHINTYVHTNAQFVLDSTFLSGAINFKPDSSGLYWVNPTSETVLSKGSYISGVTFDNIEATEKQTNSLNGIAETLADGRIVGLINSSETTTEITGATGTVTHDLTLSSVFDHSSLAADFTADFINVSTTDNRTISVALILRQGFTAYMPTAVKINETTSVAIAWQEGSAPSGTASGIDVVSFTLIKSSAGWVVIGSATSYS